MIPAIPARITLPQRNPCLRSVTTQIQYLHRHLRLFLRRLRLSNACASIRIAAEYIKNRDRTPPQKRSLPPILQIRHFNPKRNKLPALTHRPDKCWQGPYGISEKVEDNTVYLLEETDGTPKFAGDQVKKYLARKEAVQSGWVAIEEN